LRAGLKFTWRDATFRGGDVEAKGVFVIEDVNRGLGYLQNSAGERVAAPVVATDLTGLEGEGKALLGSRIVMLGFDPEPRYWPSPGALAALREAADYARQGATTFRVEVQDATVLAGEIPQLVVRLNSVRRQRLGLEQSGRVLVELPRDGQVLATRQVDCGGDAVTAPVAFQDQKTLPPGLYEVRATYEDGGKPREFYQTGFWVRDDQLLHAPPTTA
jgi:hypothetical protein